MKSQVTPDLPTHAFFAGSRRIGSILSKVMTVGWVFALYPKLTCSDPNSQPLQGDGVSSVELSRFQLSHENSVERAVCKPEENRPRAAQANTPLSHFSLQNCGNNSITQERFPWLFLSCRPLAQHSHVPCAPPHISRPSPGV